MEENVGKSRKAKNDLERAILEIKGKIEGLRKVNSKVEEQPESSLRTKWLESQPESSLRVKWLESCFTLYLTIDISTRCTYPKYVIPRLESIENRIEMEEKELECPVCLEVASFSNL